jgi:hypothetical protein
MVEQSNSTLQLEIDHIHIPFDPEFLRRWREGDPEVVPPEVLAWKGNGRQFSYGSGEFWAARYFRSKEYEVIEGYDLVSKKSIFKEHNAVIQFRLGEDRVKEFSAAAQKWNRAGFRVTTNLDMFIFNKDEAYFVDAKKGRDFLKPNQLRFIYLAQEILGVPSRVAAMDVQATEPYITTRIYSLT